MRPAFTLSAIGALLVLAAAPAQPMGFGRIVNGTQLGQRLDFSTGVALAPGENLSSECVAAEVSSGENKLQPAQLRVTLERSKDSPDRSVRVTSTSIIEEPVVTVRVMLGCTSKVSRTFVTFVDPPLLHATNTAPGRQTAMPLPPRNDSQVAPLLASVERASSKPLSVGSRAPRSVRPTAQPLPTTATASSEAPQLDPPVPAPRQRAERMAAALAAARTVTSAVPSTASPPAVATRTAQAAVPKRLKPAGFQARSGSRLKLDAAPPMLAIAPKPAPADPVVAAAEMATAIAPTATISPEPAIEKLTAQLAAERERVQGLEKSQARLVDESKAVRASLLAMQARLKAAEAASGSSNLIDLLAWLAGGLTLAVGVLAWQQVRARRAVAWWRQAGSASRLALESALPASTDNPAGEPVPTVIEAPGAFDMPADEIATPLPAAFVLKPQVYPADDMTRPAPFVMSAHRSIFESSRGVALSDLPKVEPAPPAAPERELSVEELIDLEQQVDFFSVLGQDAAAIEMLRSHVHGAGSLSPLPYLKLLEIHRRLDDAAGYERIRDRFADRFDAPAPEWGTDLQTGRGLADYPTTLARIVATWDTPAPAMRIVDASLFCRGGHDRPLDLPAYRELLMLCSVARDLAETDDVGNPDREVDLLLPFDAFDAFDPSTESPITHLVATEPSTAVDAGNPATAPLDLGVSFESIDLPAVHAAPKPPPSRSGRPTGFSSDTKNAALAFDEEESRSVAISGFHVGSP